MDKRGKKVCIMKRCLDMYINFENNLWFVLHEIFRLAKLVSVLRQYSINVRCKKISRLAWSSISTDIHLLASSQPPGIDKQRFMLPEDGTGTQERERVEKEREKLSVVFVTFRFTVCCRKMECVRRREREWRKRDKTLGRGGCPFDIFVAERLI